jgi:hypothetical protein
VRPSYRNLQRKSEAISAAIVIRCPILAARNAEQLATEEECAAATRLRLRHEDGNTFSEADNSPANQMRSFPG